MWDKIIIDDERGSSCFQISYTIRGMVIAEQLFYIYMYLSFQSADNKLSAVVCNAEPWTFGVCVRRADFSLSIIRIVTFVQVKLLLLFANTVSLRKDINKHTIQLFFLVRNKTKQSREISRIHLWREPVSVHACGYVDLMELILIWRTDWKEVNQLISHNNSVRALVCISTHTQY